MARTGISLLLEHTRLLTAGQRALGIPDQELVDRYVAFRDDDAFAALVHRHGPMVYAVCRRVLRTTHDSEDVFQATFMVLARKAAVVRKRESVSSWLHGVALRLACQCGRARQRRLRRETPLRTSPTVELGDSLSWSELRTVLDEELGQLRRCWRAPLILCYLEGRTQDEAARQLGWSKSTLRRRLERGRMLLQTRLARRGVTLSAGFLAPLLSEAPAAAVTKGFIIGTVKASLAFGAGQMIEAASLSMPVALAAGALEGMAAAKLTWAAAIVLTLGLLTGGGFTAYQVAVGNALHAPGAVQAQVPGPRPVMQKPADARMAQVVWATSDQFGDPLPADAIARLGTVRLRHASMPLAIAFAPDGRSLASGSHEGAVHIWDTSSGKQRLRTDNNGLFFGMHSVLSLDIAPDGKTLAVARLNHAACLWDTATGKELLQFGNNDHRASWVLFSPDGKTVAYFGTQWEAGQTGDPHVRLADARTGRDLHRFEGHKTGTSRAMFSRDGAAFSRDGKILACAEGAAIHLYEVATGKRSDVPRSDGPAMSFSYLMFSADGKTLAGASSKNIRLLDVGTGKTLRDVPLQEPAGNVLFTPDGQTLISGAKDGFVRFYEAGTGKKTREFRAHAFPIGALALARDGLILATSCRSHDGGDHSVRLWEAATGKPLARNPGPEQGIVRVVFSPDSRTVATGSWEGATRLWEATTGKLLKTWQAFGPLAFTADSRSLICGGWSDGKVRLLELESGKETIKFADGKRIISLALARDGNTIATFGSSILLWDLANGKQVRDLTRGIGGWSGSYPSVAFSPDATSLASSQSKTLRLWETATGRFIRQHEEPGTIGSIAFSPDGALLASTVFVDSRDSFVQLRDVATGKKLRELRANAFNRDAIAFSPDGRTLIWGGGWRTDLHLWEVATGQLRRKLPGHLGSLTGVAYSPDGRMAASGCTDGTVLIWDMTGQRDRQKQGTPLTPSQLDNLWHDLAAADAASAYKAICTLRSSPPQCVHLIEMRLKPIPRAEPKRLAEALRNLDSTLFTTRSQATKELENLGEAAELPLQQILREKPSLEVRQRVQKLLERFGGIQQVRMERALELLEQIGNPEARRLLVVLADGSPQARLTMHAQAALTRLKR